MNRLLVSIASLIIFCLNINAQNVCLYKSNKLVDYYDRSKIDCVLFSQNADDVPEKTKGTTDGHPWVQLWKYGPKIAEFNVGATVSVYDAKSTYDNVGTYGGGAELMGENWNYLSCSDMQNLKDNCDWT